jgi:hypothetical protein
MTATTTSTKVETAATTAVAAMTELGRTARWGTAALVAPLAAAALSAATSWGAAHPPAGSGKNSSTDQPADVAATGAGAAGQNTAALDKSRLVLQRQATAEQAAVIRLQKMLNRLNARTRALARAPIPRANGAASTGGVLPVVSSTGGQAGVAAPPVVAAAPAPAAPAPTTHGSTGAS